MRKFIIFIAIAFFALPAFSFEIPAGKTINKDAILSGIKTYTEKIADNPTTIDIIKPKENTTTNEENSSTTNNDII